MARRKAAEAPKEVIDEPKVDPVPEADEEPVITSTPRKKPDEPELSDEELEAQQIFEDPVTREAARTARKPDISWLEDAVAILEDGTYLPLFDVGDRIVIERYATCLKGSPWLDTQTYEVTRINDETGGLSLWNPDLKQCAMSNFITGIRDHGYVFKMAPTKGTIGKRKRGRPRKNPIAKPAPTLAPGEKKRGRGRPPGSKNRPKEVIAAEREAKRKEREDKRKGRGSKVKRRPTK